LETQGSSDAGPKPARILVIDDHPLVRRGIIDMMAREPDFEVCGEAESEADGLELIRTARADIVIMDLALREGSGLDLIHRVRALGISVPILVLSMREETVFAERVIRAGAQGYVSKGSPSEQLIGGIRKVLGGELAISPKVTERLVRIAVGEHSGAHAPRPSVDTLSNREIEIFEMVGRGLTVAAIARKLRISTKTVQAHRENIKAKLDLGTSNELARYAVLWTDGGSRSDES
jgi:DNA-binding NarL/FixJ family response regulator